MISVSSVQGVAGYRGLFAQPALRRLAVADVCARLPQGMVSLTLLLVAAQHASMTVAMAGPSGRSEHRPPPTTTRSRFGPPRSAALRRLLITAALTNAALSATEIALTAYVRHHHALWASGPLLAEISIGSIVGSVFLASRGHRLSRLLAGYAFGLGVLTGAGLYAPLLAVAAPLAGLCLGPTLATLFGARLLLGEAIARLQRVGQQTDHLLGEDLGRPSLLLREAARTPQRMVDALLMGYVLETFVGGVTIMSHAARPVDADDIFQGIGTALRVDGEERCSIITDPTVEPDGVPSNAPPRFVRSQMFGTLDVLFDLFVCGLENLAGSKNDLSTGARG